MSETMWHQTGTDEETAAGKEIFAALTRSQARKLFFMLGDADSQVARFSHFMFENTDRTDIWDSLWGVREDVLDLREDYLNAHVRA